MRLALGFFKLFAPKDGRVEIRAVTELGCRELLDAALEFQIRELAWWSCVNWIADAIGRCEVRTYREGEEIREREYYLWNYEPNVNQNSTAFWHKAVAKLYESNELLLIPSRRRDGYDAFVVADEWQPPEESPSRMREYRGVVAGPVHYDKTFREDDVLHLRLNHVDVRPVIDAMYASWYEMIKAAQQHYTWSNGQHWKVHVDQLASGADGWAAGFQQMISEQVRPFLQSGGGVLPEFDGYKYEKIDSGAGGDTRDVKALVDDVFTFTARALGIPDVLVKGEVEATGDAMRRALSFCIDPICDQFSEEATRKRYGYDGWKAGSCLRMDSSTIQHFDLFGQAANIEKLLGSGWSLNDIRRAAGENPINEPWADEHLITKNIGQLDAAEAQKGGSESDNG